MVFSDGFLFQFTSRTMISALKTVPVLGGYCNFVPYHYCVCYSCCENHRTWRYELHFGGRSRLCGISMNLFARCCTRRTVPACFLFRLVCNKRFSLIFVWAPPKSFLYEQKRAYLCRLYQICPNIELKLRILLYNCFKIAKIPVLK